MTDAGDATDRLIADVCAAAGERRGDVGDVVPAIVDRLAPLLTDHDRNAVIAAAIARLDGLDVLQLHLVDPAVDEVMVNGGGDVWVDRAGTLSRAGHLDRTSVEVVLERVLAPTGRRLDRASPIVDVRLADGSRLCAVVAPVSVGGPVVSIRRHRHRLVSIDAFAPDEATHDLVAAIITARCNVLVSGATSSGKTTFVAAALHLVDQHERLIVCEDTTELVLGGRHAVRLEARPVHADGVPPVELAMLVRAALRLRPDRLIIGEFRGVEVLAAVEAMNTGHDGSLSTCHANSAVDALHRVETLLLQAAPAWPLAAIRSQITRSIDVVIHLARDTHGRRRISEIAEVVASPDSPAVRRLHAAADLDRRR